MKTAGLFLSGSELFLREREWFQRSVAQAMPGMPVPAAVTADTPPQLLKALAAGIKKCDLILVAAEPRQYLELKTQLLRALNLPMQADQGIAAVCAGHPEDARFPAGSVVFRSPDLRHNGFAMRCGRQHMLVLPLRIELLEAIEPKVAQYLRAASGGRVIPMAPVPGSVDDVFARLSVIGDTAPLTPSAIISSAAQTTARDAGEYEVRRAGELLRRLAGRKVSCELLLPPVWAAAADFLKTCGGDAVHPVFLQEKHTDELDAAALIAQRVRASGCRYCGMISPPAADGSHAVVTLTGPDGIIRVRRVTLPGRGGVPMLAVELLAMLSECGAAVRVPKRRRLRRLASAAVASFAAVASLFFGAQNAQIQEQLVSREQRQAGAAVQLDSALLSTAPATQATTTSAAQAVPDVISALLNQSASVQEQTESAQEKAGALFDLPLAVNPLEKISELDLGGKLVDFIEWFLGLLKSVQDKIVPVLPTQAATTTAKDKTTIANPFKPASKGTFSFSVVGFGHGVGLSQKGATELGARGWTYDQIVLHYYNAPGITIADDKQRPTHVTHGGVRYELKEYLARIAYAEIGSSSVVAAEAIKAQMVCAYTVSKRNSYSTGDTNQKLLPAADWNSAFGKKQQDKMLSLASSVLGKYVAYNGQTAETLFFASCVGYTASGKYAWGGNDPLPYLTGGRSSPEAPAYSNPVFTTDEIKAFVKAYNNKYPKVPITLGADASKWIEVLRTDAYGYVEKIRIGDQELTGGQARNNFFGALNLRSHNFTVSFKAN